MNSPFSPSSLSQSSQAFGSYTGLPDKTQRLTNLPPADAPTPGLLDLDRTWALSWRPETPRYRVTSAGGLRRDWRAIRAVSGSLSLLALLLLSMALWRPRSTPRPATLPGPRTSGDRVGIAPSLLSAGARIAPRPVTVRALSLRPLVGPALPPLDLAHYEVAPAAPTPAN